MVEVLKVLAVLWVKKPKAKRLPCLLSDHWDGNGGPEAKGGSHLRSPREEEVPPY